MGEDGRWKEPSPLDCLAQVTFIKKQIRWRNDIRLGPAGGRGSPRTPPQVPEPSILYNSSHWPGFQGSQPIWPGGGVFPGLGLHSFGHQASPSTATPGEGVTLAWRWLLSGWWIRMPRAPSRNGQCLQFPNWNETCKRYGASRAPRWSECTPDGTPTCPRRAEPIHPPFSQSPCFRDPLPPPDSEPQRQ